MPDFASTAFYNLAALEFAQRGFAVETRHGFAGKTTASQKRALLDEGIARFGLEAVFAVGQRLKTFTYDPIWRVLCKAVDVPDLCQRWGRLERYYHGNNRMRILGISGNSLGALHYAVDGDSPSLGEDILIAGVLVALLQEIGCTGLQLAIGRPDIVVLKNGSVVTPMPALATRSDRWFFSWQELRPVPVVKPVLDNLPLGQTIAQHLLTDLGRNWRVGVLAKDLGLSVRSLQRRLAGEGENFQTLLRRVRVESAAARLLNPKHRLVEIGYACGYADQAHFSREFKTRYGVSPRAFQNH